MRGRARALATALAAVALVLLPALGALPARAGTTGTTGTAAAIGAAAAVPPAEAATSAERPGTGLDSWRAAIRVPRPQFSAPAAPLALPATALVAGLVLLFGARRTAALRHPALAPLRLRAGRSPPAPIDR